MDEPKILYQTEDRIARITLNASDQRNAFTYTMGAELIATLRQAEADETVRVVLSFQFVPNLFKGGFEINHERI